MLNKEVVSLEGVVKSDSCVEQRCTLFEGSREKESTSIKGRIFEGHIELRGSMVYFIREEDC